MFIWAASAALFVGERLLVFGGAQITPWISRCFFSRDRACGGLVGLIQILLSLKLLCGGWRVMGNDGDAQVIRTGSAPAVRTTIIELRSSGALINITMAPVQTRCFRGIGLVSQIVPFVEELHSVQYKRTVGLRYENSGYSIVEPMDRGQELVARFDAATQTEKVDEVK
jgi:hypothetical protein